MEVRKGKQSIFWLKQLPKMGERKEKKEDKIQNQLYSTKNNKIFQLKQLPKFG